MPAWRNPADCVASGLDTIATFAVPGAAALTSNPHQRLKRSSLVDGADTSEEVRRRVHSATVQAELCGAVVDREDPFFKNVDFAWHKDLLSRNKCLLVRLNSDHRHPSIEQLLEELNPADYKY